MSVPAHELLAKTTLPATAVGIHQIIKFEVSKDAARWDALQGMMAGTGRCCPPGKYTKLVRHGTPKTTGALVMSDTPDEIRDHHEPVRMAKDHCLIMGLGLGIVAEACLRKEGVTQVTVIELSPEVIHLVGPHLKKKWGDRLEIIEADCLEWKPPKGVRYGMVWHDIWDTMCADNLPDMHKLHRRYGRRTDWQGSWGRWYCEKQKREERDYRRYW